MFQYGQASAPAAKRYVSEKEEEIMAEQMHKIRIFIASPGDVGKERESVKSVIDELNTTIAPYKGLSLELVKWETHATPSMGRAQGVINSQLGKYDIFIGIMWKRFGTPTGIADSGTQEEFQLAYEQWEKTRSIRILFYFCQAPFMPRSLNEIEQLKKVVEFREFLANLGLTWEYSDSAEFPNVVRPHLARILLDSPSELVQNLAEAGPSKPKATEIHRKPISVTVSDVCVVHDSVEVSVIRNRPRIFISSAKEDLAIVSELSMLLQKLNCEVIRWDQGVFSAGRTIIEAFESSLSQIDAAIVLFGEESPRPNLIYELGMLQGTIGRGKTIVMGPENVKLPSDLLGTIYLRYSKLNMKGIFRNLQREFQNMGILKNEDR